MGRARGLMWMCLVLGCGGGDLAGTFGHTSTATETGSGGAGGGAGGQAPGGGSSGSTVASSGSGGQSGGDGPGGSSASSGGGGEGGADRCAPFVGVACDNQGAECGAILWDCDNDGLYEEIDCGTCSIPEACGGDGTGNLCGDKCLSAFAPLCAAHQFPSAWGVSAGCPTSPYAIVMGQVVWRVNGLEECVFLDTAGEMYMCCP